MKVVFIRSLLRFELKITLSLFHATSTLYSQKKTLRSRMSDFDFSVGRKAYHRTKTHTAKGKVIYKVLSWLGSPGLHSKYVNSCPIVVSGSWGAEEIPC